MVNEQIAYYGEGTEYITKYYYGSDGYLNSKIQTCDQNGYYLEQTYTRENGNVVRYTSDDNDIDIQSHRYTYTGYKDKANIDLMAIVGQFIECYSCEMSEMDKSVFKSLGNNNLIKTVASEQHEDDNWSFAYEFDNEEYVTRIDIYMDKGLYASITVKYEQCPSFINTQIS